MPSTAALPEDSALAPRRAAEAAEPVMTTYAAALARPIFAPDRAPVILQAQMAGSLNGYEVLGTAVAGTVSAALVRGPMGRVVRVKPDALLQGWRVVSIDRTQMILDRDGERRTLLVSAVAPRSGPALGAGMAGPAAQKASNADDDDDDSSNSKDDSDDDDDN